MNGIQINWFDILTAAVLIFGFLRGRKRGMSVELLPLFQALLIVALAAEYYEPLGKLLAVKTAMFSLRSCYITVYIAIAILIQFFFGNLKRWVGEKLVGSDLFGSGEYYVGMLAGVIKYVCILIMVLALLNAVPVTNEQVATQKKSQTDSIGMSFPSFNGIHQDIFVNSTTGKFVRERMNTLLIQPTSGDARAISSREGPAKRRESEVDKITITTTNK